MELGSQKEYLQEDKKFKKKVLNELPRQVLEMLHGVRDEAATRELIVRENRRYSRRQLIWFRKEPNLQWIHGAGERPETREAAERILVRHGLRPADPVP